MSAPPAIPDHALLRPIGRGAYGEVWLARNVMGALRAVKIIWRRHFDSERPFEREFAGIQRFEPVSRTSGGLVHVLHVGRNDAEGYFYYVMELADDAAQNLRSETTPASTPVEVSALEIGIPDSYQSRTLRSDLKRFGRLSTADCLRLAMEVAGGLAQLHRHGLVHRDVKPGNIIYVNDRAKLADIGLVTIEGEARTFVGTEGYVPPEGPGSPAADIYALGIVLYQASTGLSPERLPDVPPEWIRDPDSDLALELHEIILKASEAQRERRYASADSIQADIALLQSGQSVRHARALRRRYARLRIMGALGTVFLALAVGSAFLANYRARLAAEDRAKEARLRQEAQVAQARAEKAEGEARRQFQMALFEEARALVSSKELGHRTRALEAIRMSHGAANAPELRRLAFAALSLPDLRLEREIPISEPMAVGMDPKLEQIALTGGREVTVHSIPDFHVVATLPPSTTNAALEMRWSADSRFLAVNRKSEKPEAGSDLEVWNVSQSRLLLAVRADIARDAFSFHPKRPLLMAAHTAGAISVWDLNSGREERPFSFPGAASALAYSPDGERVAASYQRGSNWVVAFHRARDGAQLSEVSCAEPASRIAWHPLGQWVSIIGERATEWNRGVRLISPDSGEVVLLGKHKIKAAGISFSPDGNYLMSCGWERELICWDLRARQRAFAGADAGYEMFWSSTGLRCATVTRDRPRLQIVFFRSACLPGVDRQSRRAIGSRSLFSRWAVAGRAGQ
jgi:serine/threonine protein kinase